MLSPTLLATLLLAPQSPLLLHFDPSSSANRKARFDVRADLGKQQAELSGLAEESLVRTGPAGSEYRIDWRDIRFSSVASENDLPFEPFRVKVGVDGNLQDVQGGVIVSDPARTVLITSFPMPPSALPLGQPVSFELRPPIAGDVPPCKITETYGGLDTIGGESSYKIQVKLVEIAIGGLTVNATYWVNAAGVILKENGSFDNLPVSGAGTNASGTIQVIAASTP